MGNKKQTVEIDPQVVKLAGEAWAQKAITAIDVAGEGDDSAVLGYLDNTGDLHRVTVSKEKGAITVRLPFSQEEVSGLVPV